MNENETHDFSSLDTNRHFIEAGWQGSAKEPVFNWDLSQDGFGSQEGDQYTVVLRRDKSKGTEDYYNHKGDVQPPQGVVGVQWKKVYTVRNGKWELTKEA